jgi:hypothetical protein
MNGGSVRVSGVVTDVEGLPEAMKTFRQFARDTGDSLNNIAEGLKHTDDRPPYQYRPFPKAMYHPEGDISIVDDEAEMEQYKQKGYRTDPYPKPQVKVEDPATEKKLLMDRNRELEGKLAVQNDLLLKLAGRLEAIEAATKKKSA